MTVKTTKLRSIDLIQGLGNDQDGIPFRWLVSLVEKVRTLVPDTEEESCKVHGAAGLTFTYEHVLTKVEEAEDELTILRSAADEIRGLIPETGPMSDAQLKRLRELLKG